MALNAEIQESLKSMVLNDHALQTELASAGNMEGAAVVLATAARQRGIDVTSEDILSASAPAAEGALSDDQLEAVSGGSWLGDVLGGALNVVGGVPYIVGLGIGALGKQAGKL